jgi:hypothetical protein
MPTALDPTKEIPTVEDVSLEDIDREQNFQNFGGQVKDFDPESPLEPRLLEDIENAIERDNDDFAFPNLDQETSLKISTQPSESEEGKSSVPDSPSVPS